MTALKVRDLTHCVLRDGSVFCTLGDQVSSERIYGDIAFIRAEHGAYSARDGTRYEKPYHQDAVRRMQFHPRATVSTATGQVRLPGVFVSPTEIVEQLTVEEMRESALQGPHGGVLRSLESFLRAGMDGFLHESLTGQFGLIGSVGLGFERGDGRSPHDFDIVLSTDQEMRTGLLTALQARAAEVVASRVHEYGKSWQVRQHVGSEILCLFFRSDHFSSVGLRSWGPQRVTLSGVVVDISESVLTPSRLVLSCNEEKQTIYIVGLRHRGDFRVGDEATFHGRWCDAEVAGKQPERVLVVIEEEAGSISHASEFGSSDG